MNNLSKTINDDILFLNSCNEETFKEIAVYSAILKSNPFSLKERDILLNLRVILTRLCLSIDLTNNKSSIYNNLIRLVNLVITSGICDNKLSIAEINRVNAVKYIISTNELNNRINTLVVSLMYIRAHEIDINFKINDIPLWLQDTYFDYLFYVPQIYNRVGEASNYLNHIRKQYQQIELSEDSQFILKYGLRFVNFCNLIPLYFTEDSLKDILEIRAKVTSYVLSKNNYKLNHKFDKSRHSSIKRRVAILDVALTKRPESYVSLATVKLNREIFEIHFICLTAQPDSAMLEKCKEMVDKFHCLPENISKQVDYLRNLNLDLLIISTNVCAVTSNAYILTLHRLARVQMANYCCPITTGIENVDLFLIGSSINIEYQSNHFTENLIIIPGYPGCFELDNAGTGSISHTRSKYGIPDTGIVYSSTSNCYKLIPEVMNSWARILSKVENSYLLLHPYNPNWSSEYPRSQFLNNLYKIMSDFGVSKSRIIISDVNFKCRSELVNLLTISDIYLDTFPFSGSTSLIDAFEANLPVVAKSTNTLRGRQGAAFLEELGLSELVANDVSSYEEIATALALNHRFRTATRQKINNILENKPVIFNSELYGRNISSTIIEYMNLKSV